MHSTSCIFCKIIQKQIPSSIVLETDHTLVIKDLYPKAPIHYLLLTKKHIEHMGHVTDTDAAYVADLGLCVATLSKALPDGDGFNILINNGSSAGQTICHLHWHFLSGKNLYEGGLRL